MKDVFSTLGLGALGVVGIILFLVLVFVFFTTITSFVIAFIWNWCGVYNLFSAAPLSFWHVVGIAAAINLLRGVFSSRGSVSAGD